MTLSLSRHQWCAYYLVIIEPPQSNKLLQKLCQEMVEGMGGKDSVHYSEFQEYCCEAYNILRKSANLILNLFALMVDGNIQDIDQGEKSIVKVQEKLRLDLTDEEANVYFRTLITESVRALFPQIAETVHRWANYWRS